MSQRQRQAKDTRGPVSGIVYVWTLKRPLHPQCRVSIYVPYRYLDPLGKERWVINDYRYYSQVYLSAHAIQLL